VPQGEFGPPAGAELVKLAIDNETGRLASSGSKSAREMWFRKGTEPQEATPDKGAADPSQFMMQGGF